MLAKGARVWVGVGKDGTSLQIAPSRSSEAFQRIYGGFQGTPCTDRYTAYKGYEGNKENCRAYLDRDVTKVSERPFPSAWFGSAPESDGREATVLFTEALAIVRDPFGTSHIRSVPKQQTHPLHLSSLNGFLERRAPRSIRHHVDLLSGSRHHEREPFFFHRRGSCRRHTRIETGRHRRDRSVAP
ncbi:MAG: transposase [Simkaniaceae bacterium]|nr:transposase [Simkaniaceae bacterium]